MAEAGIPTVWNTYFAVDNVDETVRKVGPAGGRAMLEPVDVADFGRQAVVEDSVGATLALWQAITHIGATLSNGPGSIVWHELAAGNCEYAVPFYLDVFGVEWKHTTNRWMMRALRSSRRAASTSPALPVRRTR